ncbi:hypothetical protein GCM10010451_37990 [Streptomyces virens]|uniref:Uncharacterized protein n=1 Tax=Streptomyces virens TaxID=285572 RepID=A0ABP6PS29_9ACTN|nr:hypothetical protein [Streptomyces calvus]MBA8980286.1 hypothetical protein [Streptomyces calvus]
MKEFIRGNAAWLTVYLSSTAGIWMVKRDPGDLAAADLSGITRAVKRRMKGINRPDLGDGRIAATSLSPDG